MLPHKTPLTPCIDSGSVIAILKLMGTSNLPEYVVSKPNQAEIENECFPMVDEYIKKNQGEKVLGWALWELPGLFIEAEFHAVWKSPKGELLDLNPRPLKTEKILFLPDPNLTYDGYQKNNFRLALTNNPTIFKFLELHDRLFDFMNRDDRKGQYGEINLKGKAAYEYGLIAEEMAVIQMQMNTAFKPLGPYDPCICGSGKKAKWCHKLK